MARNAEGKILVGPNWYGCAMSLSEVLDCSDAELFPTEGEHEFIFHLALPHQLQRQHRAFYVSGLPERVVHVVMRELEDWAKAVQRERAILRGEKVLA
jgi:hypothetical protein